MNDRRADRGVSRDAGDAGWMLGFTFGLRLMARLSGCARRDEGREDTVRYWRMISCLHSSDPVSNEGEMRAGPIWNNRIPFAIVFLSVSLFLGPDDGYKLRTTNGYPCIPCVYVCTCGSGTRTVLMRGQKVTEGERKRKVEWYTRAFVLRVSLGIHLW